MKLNRPWHILFIISSNAYQKKNLSVILASGKTWYLKHCIWSFKMENFISYLLRKIDESFFLNHHLKSDMRAIKHQQKQTKN